MAVSGGIVSLVGAGPGDPGLVTANALAAIARADVVVYDRLVSPALVAQARPGAELIYVGKETGHHGRKQADISGLLADQALAGKRVCRLKGGDPFVFGRGGEEAELLRALGVDYEVVPGITAGIAAAAYAGIPVTHRDFAGAVTLVTGHDAPCKVGPDVDWDRLAGAGGTLLIYMGVEALAGTARRLIAGGRAAATPVAVVRWGTRAEQQVVTASLATIADEVNRAGVKSPAMIIVGEVVRLADRLTWLKSKPLFGRRVLLPMVGGHGGANAVSELAAPLRAAGAEVWEWPVGTVADAELGEAVRTIERYDGLLLADARAVPRLLAQLLAAGLDARTLYRVRLGALDAPTAAALTAAGLRPDFIGVGDVTALAGINRLLVAGEADAASLTASDLRELGIRADAAPTHAIHRRTELAGLLRAALAAGEISDLLLPDPSLLPLLLDVVADPELLADLRIADTADSVLLAAEPVLL